jgi:sialate O-acetylesterase
LAADASLRPVFVSRAREMSEYPETLLDEQNKLREIANAKAAGKPYQDLPWRLESAPLQPAALYNAMIAPLTPFPITGVIWYQGENNADEITGSVYAQLMRTMIDEWRASWGQGDFPFLYVQIANWNKGGDWPNLRDQQRKALNVRNTAMAVTIDIGDGENIHPVDKQDVAYRLALAARALEYKEDVEYSGPLFRQIIQQNGTLILLFDHEGGGLVAKDGALRGFEIAGNGEKYHAAMAKIEGDTVVLSSQMVKDPSHVRYGWAPNPDCNLYNGDGLPASPFEARINLVR